jgi:subtilisin family serine protease
LPEENFYLVYIEGIEDLEDYAAQMTEDPAVSIAEANYYLPSPEAVRQMVIAAVGGTWEEYADQELTGRIGLDEAHQASLGAGVVVAILDTGLDPEHQAFDGRLSSHGYDFVDYDDEPWEEANGQDDDEDGLTDAGYGHGTMVAGIVALVAPEATILPIRVLNDEGQGNLFAIAQGMIYARIRGADVINMSFGVPLNTATMEHFLRIADHLGLLIAAGAGNENREEPPYYPAYDERVFMITALDSLDVKADFADFNSEVLVSAPGVAVRSAYPGDDWGIGSGCSFATPFVSGEIALILSLFPAWDREETATRLQTAVDPIYEIPGNEPYLDKLGTGRIYLPLAVGGLTSLSEGGAPFIRGIDAWPNPSRGMIHLRITDMACPMAGVRIHIIDPAGRLVRELVQPKRTTVTWDGRDDNGNPVPTGAYFARTTATNGTQTVPLILLR